MSTGIPPTSCRQSTGLGTFSRTRVSERLFPGPSFEVKLAILTEIGTVISIHETPNYEPPRRKDPLTWRAEELKNMRKNTLDLLFQLSIPGMEHYRHRVSSQKGVRSDLLKPSHRGSLPRARTTIVEPSVAVDASSNLFFYLFEDYTAATSILSTSNDVLAKLVGLLLDAAPEM